MTQSRLVGNRYELGELIGYGGMAEVHRGHDVRLGREVAIKVLRSDLARDPTFQARFRREAQAAAGLNHPAIVAVYDTGEDAGLDGPIPYIVMEFVEGRTLRDILKIEGRLPARRAMEVVADVCAALDFSHRNGIVHRDIKPANVMITANGAVKVMDFGIARALADNAATVTQTAAVIGTAQYLSPEQARGESVDARSDVYSTGCLLYELITGHPPFMGDSPVAVAYQHVRENAPVPSSINPDVPPSLDSIVMKSLAKNPLNRYQSAGEMRNDLLRALANEPVQAEALLTDAETMFIARGGGTGPVRMADEDDLEEDHRKRNVIIWSAVVLALLLVIGGAAWALLRGGSGNATKGPVTVQVPDLTGMSPQGAADKLRSVGLTPSKDKPAADTGPCGPNLIKTVPENSVCNQTPSPDADVSEGSTVKFTVFTVGTVQVPSVTQEPFDQAKAELAQRNLVAKRQDVANPAAVNTVVGQSPDAGTSVRKGATITLQVSTGKIQVPDVRNLPFEEASARLQQAGFTNIQRQDRPVNDQAADNKVLDQFPANGVDATPDTTIVLGVGKFTPPPTTPTATPTTTTPTATPTATDTTTTPPTGATTTPAGGTTTTPPAGGGG